MHRLHLVHTRTIRLYLIALTGYSPTCLLIQFPPCSSSSSSAYAFMCGLTRLPPHLQGKTNHPQRRLFEQKKMITRTLNTQPVQKPHNPSISTVGATRICFIWDKRDGNPLSYLVSLIFTHTCWDKVNTSSEADTLMDDVRIKASVREKPRGRDVDFTLYEDTADETYQSHISFTVCTYQAKSRFVSVLN